MTHILVYYLQHSHLHVQEEVKVMQMMGDDTEVNVMEPKLWSMELTCKCRHLVQSPVGKLNWHLIQCFFPTGWPDSPGSRFQIKSIPVC